MVQFQSQNGWVHLRVQRSCDEFAAQVRDSIVEKLKEHNGFADLKVLADGSDTLVFAVGLPEADGLTVGVPRR